MKIGFIFTFTAMIFLMATAAPAQNTSVYTRTSTKACRTIASDPNEAGYYEGECRGAGGYKVRLIEGDIRQTLTVISPSRKKTELNLWQFFPGFSYVGDPIEWRLKRSKPVALIARYTVSDGGYPAKNTSYLMIAKILPTGSCVVDVVDPGPGQNERARKLADSAAEKPCKQLPE